jgi:hypothetical protein
MLSYLTPVDELQTDTRNPAMQRLDRGVAMRRRRSVVHAGAVEAAAHRPHRHRPGSVFRLANTLRHHAFLYTRGFGCA